MRKYISIDIETTGYSHQFNRIVELGAVQFLDDGEELDRFQELVNPGQHIPANTTEIHGITDDMVKNARPFHEVIKDFFKFIGSNTTPLLAHNAAFDVRFLNFQIRTCFPNHSLSYNVFDTMSLSKAKNPLVPSHKLPYLVDLFKLNEGDFAVGGFHGALLDSLHLKNLWLKLEGPAYPESKLKKFRICNHG